MRWNDLVRRREGRRGLAVLGGDFGEGKGSSYEGGDEREKGEKREVEEVKVRS